MLRILVYWVDTRRWFIIAVLICLIFSSLPVLPGLNENGMDVLAIVIMTTIILITAPVPLPTVALLIAVFQVLFGITDFRDVAKTFMSDSVFFIMGSLMLAVAIVKQKLDKRIAFAIIKLTGASLTRISLGFIVVSALMASFIGEHTVAAIMLPVAITLVANLDSSLAKRRPVACLLMFSIAYGCAAGSIGTPSGGARNAIMLDYWSRLQGIEVSYIQWIKYAYPMVLLQVPIFALILRFTYRTHETDISGAVNKLIEKVRSEGKMRFQEWLTIAIFLVTLTLWVAVSDRIGLGVPALIGVIAYLATGLVRWRDINSGVNWGVVLLYASAISLGVAMQRTGAASWFAGVLVDGLGVLNVESGVLIIVVISVLMMMTANIMSHGPAVAILGPIFLEVAVITETNILAVGFTAAIAASFTYLTVIGSPANTIVYGSGFVKTRDYMKAGWKLTIVSVALMAFLSAAYWRFL